MLRKIQFETKILHILTLVIVVVVGLLMYSPALVDLVERWEKQEEYSHGFLIPFVTLYFIWQKKQSLKNIPFQATWLGFTLVLLGLVLYIVGNISILYTFIDYSLIMVLTGLIWSMLGTQALKVIIVPLLMLIFAIPLPYFLDAILSSELQLLSSRLGVEFIIWCKIPVFLEGNVIDLGDFKLQVVEACSGLRYLFPLMSIGFICAYLFNTVLWKRVLVFLSSIPITIIMNSFRIGVVGLLVNQWGIEVAEGFLHDFEGWAVFMASLTLMIFLMLILAKLSKNPRPLAELFGVDNVMHQNEQQQIPFLLKINLGFPFYLSLLSMILVGGVLFSLDNREEIIPARKSFVEFPMQIDTWQGKRDVIDKPTMNVLKLTDYIYTDYRGNGDSVVNLFIAYYESQRNNVMPHSPRVCIPGGGWEIAKISRQLVNGFPVNRMVIKKGLARSLMYYWYQQRGQILANEYKMKWSLFTDALNLNRTDGALVRLNTRVYPGESLDEAEKRLESFYVDVMPLLGGYIPN